MVVPRTETAPTKARMVALSKTKAMGLEDAGELILHIVLSKLSPESTATVACVSKSLRVSASEESLWSIFCSRDLNISTPLDHHGNAAPSFKTTYQLWRESFRMYPWNLVKRVRLCWDNLKLWLSLNFPEAKATLRKGATEEDLQELESVLKVKLPLPTRLLYRFVDGQDISSSNRLYESLGVYGYLGIIGGYFVTSAAINVYLLPPKEMIRVTKIYRSYLGFSSRVDLIAVAASKARKIFLLDCTNGQLYTQAFDCELLPCVPDSLVRSVHDINGDQQQDGLLLWLEEHGRRLQTGTIKFGQEYVKCMRLLDIPPFWSVAITNGVQVRVSIVFLPERWPPSRRYVYAYSIRMSLMPEGCIINGTHHSSCQLLMASVNGFVIEENPLLQAGGEEFVYELLSAFPKTGGSFEGSFIFVSGSLRDPQGSQFEVKVAELPLELPDYIF